MVLATGNLSAVFQKVVLWSTEPDLFSEQCVCQSSLLPQKFDCSMWGGVSLAHGILGVHSDMVEKSLHSVS